MTTIFAHPAQLVINLKSSLIVVLLKANLVQNLFLIASFKFEAPKNILMYSGTYFYLPCFSLKSKFLVDLELEHPLVPLFQFQVHSLFYGNYVEKALKRS